MTCVCVYVKINFKKIFPSMCIEYTHTLNISKKKNQFNQAYSNPE